MTAEAESLRKAIERLIDVKLLDVLKPGGVDRLLAHRLTGVASFDIRNAERHLDEALETVIARDRRGAKVTVNSALRLPHMAEKRVLAKAC